jgi:hypothetical protein
MKTLRDRLIDQGILAPGPGIATEDDLLAQMNSKLRKWYIEHNMITPGEGPVDLTGESPKRLTITK